MFPAAECPESGWCMVMVWDGDDHSIDVIAFDQFSIIGILNGFWMLIFGTSQTIAIDIADSHYVFTANLR